MTGAERVRAELEILGLDASRHVLDFYAPLLTALEITRARDVHDKRSRAELLVAGVKVATQTPPIRTGRRVVFLTLDDSTGPIDATFFEDAQGPYAGTVFHSWLLVVRGVLRKTGARGLSLRATGAWELPMLWNVWTESGLAGVHDILLAEGDPQEHAGRRSPAVAGLPAASFHGGLVMPAGVGSAAPGRVVGTNRDDGALPGSESPDWEAPSGLPNGDRASARPGTARTARPGTALPGSALSGSGRPGSAQSGSAQSGSALPGSVQPDATRQSANDESEGNRAGGMGGGRRYRRVLVHSSGYRQSPYADLKPPGDDTRETRRMLAAEEATGREQEHRREQERREQERRRQEPRKLWHASPGSSGR